MDRMTRRRAIELGVLSGSALVAKQGQAEAADEKDVILADEKAVVFNIRNVTIERVDQAARTITASFGKQDNPIKVTDLPLGKDIRIVLTNRYPSSRNHERFEIARLGGTGGQAGLHEGTRGVQRAFSAFICLGERLIVRRLP
jgi:hypothetical protein